MTITLENDMARELISFKLQHLQSTMRGILRKWNNENIEDFILAVKCGELENAEMDAITIRQLVVDLDRLQKLLENIPPDELK